MRNFRVKLNGDLIGGTVENYLGMLQAARSLNHPTWLPGYLNAKIVAKTEFIFHH